MGRNGKKITREGDREEKEGRSNEGQAEGERRGNKNYFPTLGSDVTRGEGGDFEKADFGKGKGERGGDG